MPTPGKDFEHSESTSTSRSLLKGLHENDQQAWDRLVKLYTPLVWHWCRTMNLPTQDSADIFQEIFRSVALYYPRFHRDRPGDTFRGWLKTITRNKINDYFRTLSHEPQGVGGTEANIRWSRVPETTTELDDYDFDRPAIRDALELIKSQFEATTWKAFWGVVIDGRLPVEVGLDLGITPGAVRVAKCRVLQRLRHELGDLQ